MFWLSVKRRLVKKHPRKSAQPSVAAIPAANRCTDRCNMRSELSERQPLKENGFVPNGDVHIQENGIVSRNGTAKVVY
jgi:hypothetical protein